MSTSRTLVNQGNVSNLIAGDSHVLYATGAAFVVGALVIGAGWAAGNWALVVAGIVILVAMTSIAVDLWSHGYQH